MGFCILVAGHAHQLLLWSTRAGSSESKQPVSDLSPRTHSSRSSQAQPLAGPQAVKRSRLLQAAVAGIFGLYVVLLGVKTVVRNAEWQSDFSIHQADSQTNPLNAKLLTNFGLLQYEKSKTLPAGPERRELEAGAEQYFLKALALDATYPAAAFDYGNLLHDQGKVQECIAMYKRGLNSIDKSRVPLKILNNLATVEFQQGDHAAAELHFKMAIQIEPTHITAHNGLGALYGSIGQQEKSEYHFREALKINPSYAEGHFNLGTLMVQQGRLDEGEAHLLRTLEINPQHHGARNNLEVVHFQRRQQGKSKRA